VTCTIDSGGPIAGDDVQWYEDGPTGTMVEGAVGAPLVWNISDSETHSVYVVIVRATLSSAPSNTVSGSDTLPWS
jgi:hypothetical protein